MKDTTQKYPRIANLGEFGGCWREKFSYRLSLNSDIFTLILTSREDV